MRTGSEAVREGREGKVRERIVRESTRLFAARGFDATPLQAVADAVGVTKQAILHHFQTKDDLHRAVLEGVLAPWNQVIPQLLAAAGHDGGPAGEPGFDAIMTEIVRFFMEDVDRARLIVREVMDRPDEMRRLLRRDFRSWINLVADDIRKAQRAGIARPEVDPDSYLINTINLVVCGLASLACLGALFNDGEDPRAAQRYVAELIRMARVSLFVDRK